jgi:hypothetical protein
VLLSKFKFQIRLEDIPLKNLPLHLHLASLISGKHHRSQKSKKETFHSVMSLHFKVQIQKITNLAFTPKMLLQFPKEQCLLGRVKRTRLLLQQIMLQYNLTLSVLSLEKKATGKREDILLQQPKIEVVALRKQPNKKVGRNLPFQTF